MNSLSPVGQAIYCDCYLPEFDRYKILGSVTAGGVLEVLRGHKNKTIIETHELLISCEVCGFKKLIKTGSQSQSSQSSQSLAVNRPTYEKQ